MSRKALTKPFMMISIKKNPFFSMFLQAYVSALRAHITATSRPRCEPHPLEVLLAQLAYVHKHVALNTFHSFNIFFVQT